MNDMTITIQIGARRFARLLELEEKAHQDSEEFYRRMCCIVTGISLDSSRSKIFAALHRDKREYKKGARV